MIRFLVFFLFSFAAIAGEITVNKIEVDCNGSRECKSIKKEFSSLKRKYTSIDHIKKVLKVYLLNEGIKNFRYELWEYEDFRYKLKLYLTSKPVTFEVQTKIIPPGKDVDPVSKVVVGLASILKKSDYEIELPTILPLKEGDFLDDNKIKRTIELLLNTFISKGFVDAKIKVERTNLSEGVRVKFNCYVGRPIRVDKIVINSENEFLKNILLRKLSLYKGRKFDLQQIKDSIDESSIDFSEYGYYLNDLMFQYKVKSKYRVDLHVDINANQLHVFYIKGANKIHGVELKGLLVNYLKTFRKELEVDTIVELISKKYNESGLLNSKVSIVKKRYKDIDSVSTVRYDLKIDEGEYFKLNKLDFIGNDFLTDNELRALFYENSFDLNSYGIVDSKYYESFNEKIRETYVSLGFVNLTIDAPKIEVLKEKNLVNVTFKMREGFRAKIDKINFEGVPLDLSQKLKDLILNQEQTFFNPLELDNDLVKITDHLSSMGYYFSTIVNSKSPTLVNYNSDNSLVNLNFKIDLKKQIYLNKIIIIGNRKTRSIIIKRALSMKEGDLISQNAIRSSQTNLLSLGLFNSISLSPVESGSQKVDLLISLKEKDFGLLELAPGVRTDLGLKLSGSVSYINIDGLNKQISFKGQINQRLDFETLDERRKQDGRQLLEYQSSVIFNENNIFNSGLDFNTSITTQRRRFFSFDADIQRFNTTVTRDWTSWFGTSLKLQVESIAQFDATEERDSGQFQIGSLTPAMSFDFRNNRVNPTKGAFFNFSGEFASPTFFSQDNEDLVINYYKLVSRSRFYIPYPNGTFAVSLTAGTQKNLATQMVQNEQGAMISRGFIPNIKVFRLSGIDIVRGFEDDEINRLSSGVDISEVVVDDTAYMANIKIEPRYFLNDSMMLGLFYDAGSVFVDSYDLSKLRSSVGLTFKYLTPVGTLDFDYGIKLLRKRNADGILDTPGRLHVSIGFF